jgi:hypothetical protein
MTEETARTIQALLHAASRAVDDSVVAFQRSPDASAEELSSYKRAAGRTLMTIFDELLLPIYREHPALVPKEIAESLNQRESRRPGGDQAGR